MKIQSNVKKEADGFELEWIRHKYAKGRNSRELRRTYTSKYLTIEDVNTPAFWDKVFKKEKKNYGGMYADKERVIINELKDFRGKPLSIGFGTGRLEEKLAKQGIGLYGIDISKYAVEKAKKRIKGTFKKASILKIPFYSKTFDAILLLEVIEHIVPSKTFKALAEVKRVLKDKGKLILSVPLNEPLEEMIRKGQNPSGHVRIYT